MLGQLRSTSNGSFSISFPTSQDEEQTEKLAQALANVHGHAESILDAVYEMLPEDKKSQGKLIQRQNYLRKAMLGRLTNVSDAQDRVEVFLRQKSMLYIPEGAFLELKIVGGGLTFSEPMGDYWREGEPMLVNKSSRSTWVANWDLFGRTRMPLHDETMSDYALKAVFGMAKSFEDYWKDKSITNTRDIINGFLEWSQTLPGKDTKIKTNPLSEDEKAELNALADQLVAEMRQW